MSRRRKIKLLANAVLQDFADSNSNIEICKYAAHNLLGNNTAANTGSLSALLADEENTVDVARDNLYLYTKSQNSTERDSNALFYNYAEKDFYFDFHMRRETFYKLLLEIKRDRYFQTVWPVCGVSFEKSLLMTVWYLAKGGTLLDICDKFEVNLATFSIIETTLETIVRLQTKWIVWPDQKQSEISANSFLSKYGYPGVVGALGCIHINFKPPADREQVYRNKSLGHSLVLQAMCNAHKQFMNIFTGLPGTANAATVLKHSGLYKDIEETSPAQFFYNRYHLVADAAYPLRSWLITPFRHEDSVTSKHVKHNACLTATLAVVEDTFAALLERWRVLRCINVNSVNHAVTTIRAGCVLHNFCVKQDDLLPDMIEQLDDRTGMEYVDVTRKGVQKRHRNLHFF